MKDSISKNNSYSKSSLDYTLGIAREVLSYFEISLSSILQEFLVYCYAVVTFN